MLEDFTRMLDKTGEGGEVAADFVVKDPAMMVALRGSGTSLEAQSQSYLHQTAARNWGEMAGSIKAKLNPAAPETVTEAAADAHAAAKGFRKMSPVVAERSKKFLGDDVYLPNDIADMMERHFAIDASPQLKSQLGEAFKGVNNWWKGATLGVRLPFHVRNYATMVYMNFAAGMTNPVDHVTSLALSHKLENAVATMAKTEGKWSAKNLKGAFWDSVVVDASGNTHTWRDLVGAMQKNGVHGSGLWGVEGAAIQGAAHKPGTVNPLSTRNHLMRLGFNLGRKVENTGRGQLFLHKVLNEGLDYRSAAKEVAKWHFDYNDLTTFEDDIRNYMFPFYAWSRKNLPIQASLTLTRAPLVTWLDKARERYEYDGTPVDYYGVEKWMKDSLPIRVAWDEESKSGYYFMMKNWVPAADLQEIFQPMDLALDMATPVIKLPFEIGSNYSKFFDPKIERYPGQTRTLWGIEMGAKSQYALRTVGFLSWTDQLAQAAGVDQAIHKGLYGTPMPEKETDATGKTLFTAGAPWLRAATGLKIYGDKPAEVMMSNEYEYRDQLRQKKREVKYYQEFLKRKEQENNGN